MKLKIAIDGKTYEVDVEASEPEVQRAAPTLVTAPVRVVSAPPPPAAGSAGEAVADESKVCRSPISGTVVKVVAQPGQAVQVGDILVVLEAMKMETNITAPIAAKIAKLNVAVGDAVRSGQVVVGFD